MKMKALTHGLELSPLEIQAMEKELCMVSDLYIKDNHQREMVFAKRFPHLSHLHTILMTTEE